MHIARAPQSNERLEQANEALRVLLRQPTTDKVRPCSNCDISCACSGSSTCTCGCGWDCKNAPAMLSSEPVGFPIEDGIVPLVFELTGLRVFHPCWSCEGHTRGNGTLFKIPRVWFEPEDLIYVNLIDHHLKMLRAKKMITNTWLMIVVTPIEDTRTCFSIEPDRHQASEVSLSILQREVKVIAHTLREGVIDAANETIAGIRRHGRAA